LLESSIHGLVGPRAGDRHLNVTISVSQVPLPVPVAVTGWFGGRQSFQDPYLPG
jgi:hypothetical protein